MVNCDSESTVRHSRRVALLHSCGVILVFTLLAGCSELLGDLVDDADIGYCYGCDWIVQEWYGGEWETRNSKPYDTEELCEQKLKANSQEDPDQGFRCIHEEELIDQRREQSRNPSQEEKAEVESCWNCDWRVEEWRYERWSRIDSTTYDTQSVCEQALWYESKEKPYVDYRCVY
jgi:hypothetical protein